MIMWSNGIGKEKRKCGGEERKEKDRRRWSELSIENGVSGDLFRDAREAKKHKNKVFEFRSGKERSVRLLFLEMFV
jgi:hypothetical protein